MTLWGEMSLEAVLTIVITLVVVASGAVTYLHNLVQGIKREVSSTLSDYKAFAATARDALKADIMERIHSGRMDADRFYASKEDFTRLDERIESMRHDIHGMRDDLHTITDLIRSAREQYADHDKPDKPPAKRASSRRK